jgi:hypothetical protein
VFVQELIEAHFRGCDWKQTPLEYVRADNNGEQLVQLWHYRRAPLFLRSIDNNKLCNGRSAQIPFMMGYETKFGAQFCPEVGRSKDFRRIFKGQPDGKGKYRCTRSFQQKMLGFEQYVFAQISKRNLGSTGGDFVYSLQSYRILRTTTNLSELLVSSLICALRPIFIDELKDRADLVRLIEPYAPLKKKGASWMACCPFHQEKTPSFSVNPAKGFYKCFGCGKGGNAFHVLDGDGGLSFPEAVQRVAENERRSAAAADRRPQYEQNKKRKEEKKQLADQVIELNKIALEFGKVKFDGKVKRQKLLENT